LVDNDRVVRAAGVVLLRGDGAARQTLVLHRPHRRDWSLPKGKFDAGEHVVECAVRECDEETGILARLRMPLGQQRYQAMGRPKTVDYWVAEIGADNGFTPDDEVAEIRWVGLDEARALLTYRRDVEYVERAFALPRTWPLLIVRHAAAVSRSTYNGPDLSRPLTGKGRTQARALTGLLSAYGVARAHSSDANRCIATVAPYSQLSRVTIEQEPQFSEPGFEAAPTRAVQRYQSLLSTRDALALCTHRPVLPTLLTEAAALATGPAADLLRSLATKGLSPGAFVTLHRRIRSDGHVSIEAMEHSAPKKALHEVRMSRW